MSQNVSLPPSVALPLESLVTPTEQGIASRVLTRGPGGNVSLFAFDEGQELTEHTSPFDALVVVVSGQLLVTISGQAVEVGPGMVVRMPAHAPHALHARTPTRMLLVMLRHEAGGAAGL